MNINIIGVPIMYGCDRKGVEKGPNSLREAGMIDILAKNTRNQIYDLGNLYVPEVEEKHKYSFHKEMKYLDPIIEINRNLGHLVYMSLKSNSFPLIIGGDHSLALGSLAGASRFYENMAVIWVDAHGDINDHRTSPSKNIHGMVSAASFGLGHPSLKNIYYEGRKFKSENLYILGVRDLDPGELELAKKLDLKLYGMEIVKKQGLNNILDRILESIRESGVHGVHLSFDIDVLDKNLVPGTGTPSSGGFNLEEAKLIIGKILTSKLVTSMDLVEYNPSLDQDQMATRRICLELLETIGRNL